MKFQSNLPSTKIGLLATFCLLNVHIGAYAAPFTAGNVVIYRVGTGSAALSNASAAVFLDEYTPTGTLVQSVALPIADSGANQSLTASGTATSGGLITRSSDGQYVIVTGYDSIPGVASITGTATTSVTRVLGRVAADGSINTSTTTTSFSADNIRGATSSDGSAFWASGANTGIIYQTLGGSGAGTVVSSSVTNTRSVDIFGGQLYVSSGSGTNTFRGVNAVGTGLPTATGQTTTRLPGLNDTDNPSSFQFFFADLDAGVSGDDTLYIADDGLGALTKWALVGGTWTRKNTIGANADDYRGLTGSVSGSTVTLYATRDNGAGADTLVSLIDATGYNANITATPTLIATAATNTAFRGVTLAPVSASSLADLATSVAAPATSAPGANFDYTITASNTGVSNATGVAVDFTLPAGLTFVSASGSGFTAVNNAGVVEFTGGSINASSNVPLTVTVTPAGSGAFTAAIGAAVIDPDALVTESNEANNTSPTAVTTTVSSLVSIAAASINEGNSGTVILNLPVTRDATNTEFTVNFEVTSGTATAGTDYVTVTPGTLTFLAGGAATQNISITVNGDTDFEPSETITVSLSGVVNTTGLTTLGTSAGTGTITNDDTLPPPALLPGEIAFIGFNADGDDNLSFVALAPIPAGTEIFFTDNEWNGQAIGAGGAFNTGEMEFKWTAPSGGVAAGSVVTLNGVGAADPTTTVGSIAHTVSSNLGISATADIIYAYVGSSLVPTGFVAAITNAPIPGADSEIGNTGLAYGTTAINLGSNTDGGRFTGLRSGQTTFADYLTLIGNVTTSWETTTGDGSAYLPFNSGVFSTGMPSTATVEIAATVSAAEGNSGTTPLTFAVTRSLDSTAFSVDYAVTGGTATSGTDFTALASGTLTFTGFSGPLVQNITVDILGDAIVEPNETIIITLSNLVQTTGTTSLGNATGTGTITNDDSLPTVPASGSLTTTLKGFIDLDAAPLSGGSEIPAFDPASKRAFASSGVGIQVVDLTNPATPTYITTIAPASFNVAGLNSNDVSSITVRKGTGGNPSILAAGIINSPKTANGHVVFLNAATGALIGSAVVGSVPDHIAFTPDGTKLLVCNEGELDGSSANISTENVPGTVSIVDVTNLASPVVTNVGFASFNASAAALKTAGVRIFDGGIPEFDFEPEYLSISPDGTKAMVTLQEANAVAILDIATATFTSVVPLGEKNFSGLYADFSDQDGGMNLTTGNPVFGLYMPDAIASYQVGGQTYYVIANEGDDRDDFINPNETIRVGGDYDLDNATFPNEVTLKNVANLGRLTVSNAPGLRGDNEPTDGDIDRILKYGARSFSILDSTGAQVYDSGDMIELIVANQFPALFDDTRSDNKGPEPEGVTVAKIGARTYAFVGLERSHMTLAFDVTNPLSPTFATAFQRNGDLNPEGMVVVQAADSPSGKPLLLVSNEVSNTLTVFELNQTTDFKLQLLHLADAEAGLLASDTAPNLAALVDGFDGIYPNTLILAGGDNFIPGPFLAGGTDITVRDELNAVTGSSISMLPSANHPIAAVDIAIHNIIGVEASTIGNHEFDLGTRVFRDSFISGSGWVGANFPYLSANLDFSGDLDLTPRFTNTLSGNNTTLIAEASTLKGRIAPSAVITKGGEKIGLVAATTQIVESISSLGGVEVKGFAGDGLETNNMALLASQLQPAIDELKSEGVDKIILMAHLQQITFEQELALLLNGVDIILAAGSNTRLGDSNDIAALFTGHSDNFAANYPIYTAGSDGLPTVIVNTDNEFTYLGRLVADFDSDGVLIVPNLTANIVENGAYAATEANVAAAWNIAVQDVPAVAFATGTKGELVKRLTDAVQAVILIKDGDIRGYTDVYLEGERNIVRNQETNLGDVTADSMLAAAKVAMPNEPFIATLKNGGGIRSAIGAIEVSTGNKLPPIANPEAGKLAGQISLLDIENALRFNNSLMVCDITPTGLKAILEHGVFNAGTGNGRFPQVGGLRFSYNTSLPQGSRIVSAVLVDEDDNITARIISGGAVRPDAPALIKLVTLSFLAGNNAGVNAVGGDDYPFKANAENFRYLLNDDTLSDPPVDEALSFTAAAPGNVLNEQVALSDYLQVNHAAPATAYNIAETVPALDTRIQSVPVVRTDTVLAGPATFTAWLALNGFTSGGINTDTDLDGATDLVEYFFNQSTNSGSDNGNLPVVTMASGERFLTFTTNNTVAGVNGVLQTSNDLGLTDSWDTAVEGVDYEAVSSAVAGAETTTTIKLLGAAAKKFWRHRVSSN